MNSKTLVTVWVSVYFNKYLTGAFQCSMRVHDVSQIKVERYRVIEDGQSLNSIDARAG